MEDAARGAFFVAVTISEDTTGPLAGLLAAGTAIAEADFGSERGLQGQSNRS